MKERCDFFFSFLFLLYGREPDQFFLAVCTVPKGILNYLSATYKAGSLRHISGHSKQFSCKHVNRL